jgi:protein-tyrosine phosphatase
MKAELGARDLSWRVDSAGTGDWHVGRPPDPRAQAQARAQGHDISGYRARQLCADDFAKFDHIIALDRTNLTDIGACALPGSAARISLLLDHVPGRAGEDVADPYYGDAAGFAVTWEDVRAGAAGLIAHISDQRRGNSAITP